MKTIFFSEHYRFQRTQSRSTQDKEWEYRIRPKETWLRLIAEGVSFAMFLAAVIYLMRF